MALGKRIRRLREERGLGQAELARRAGIELGTLTALEARDSVRSQFAPQIARALGVTLSELLDNQQVSKGGRESPTLPLTRDPYTNVARVPTLKGKAPLISWAATGMDRALEGARSAAREWIDTTGDVSSKAFALQVTGDSMFLPGDARSIPDGAIVVIDPDAEPAHGRVVLARRAGGEPVLRLLWIDGQKPYLKPLNDRYPILEAGDAKIVGVAVEYVVRRQL